MNFKTVLFFLFCVCNATLVSSALCPNYCKCHMNNNLRYSSCVNKKLINLDVGLPRTAEWIDLSNNTISALPDHAFGDVELFMVVKVILQYNQISRIERLAFDGLNGLEHVNLKGNRLVYIIPSTFEWNIKLSYLDLSDNPLRDPHLISQSLQVLNLAGCRIHYLNRDVFRNLPSLRELNISSNYLLSMDYTLEPLTRLQMIDYSSNMITCNDRTRELQLWLSSRRIRFSGVYCPSITTTVKTKQQEQKFQKILMSPSAEELEDSEENDSMPLPPKWDDIENSLDQSEEPSIPHSDDVRPKQSIFANLDYLMISFGTGCAIGSILAYISVACWFACSKYRRKRVQRPAAFNPAMTPLPVQYVPVPNPRVQMPASVDPTAPPPSYNTLFQ